MVSQSIALSSLILVLASAPLGAQPALPQSSALRSETDVRSIPPSVTEQKAKPAISHEMRGDIFMARKMYREAIDCYKEMMAERESAVLYNKIGIAHHQMMDLSTAKKWYEKAIKQDKKYAEAINNLGAIYYAQKSYRRAVGQYKKALRITPASASIHSNLGTAYFARKKYKDAAQEYETALKLDPEVFEHRSTQGVLLQERSVAERAKFHFYLAKTYAKAGVTDRALQYMRKAIEEGFKDRDKFREDSEFAGMQELPEFKELLALEARVL